ncbi:hypothetical protein CI41S_66690 [Bradyrhizobium ivorense]|nr:hypothetical protein CI41S_66690 [Bradyrhizobium ivorense]
MANPSRQIFAFASFVPWKIRAEVSKRCRPVRSGAVEAIELANDWRSTGSREARMQGGNRRSARTRTTLRRSSAWSKPRLM